MLKKICPCLAWINTKKETKGYHPHNQLEEQEFMQHLNQEAKKSDIYPQSSGAQVSIEEQLQHELHFQQTPQFSSSITPENDFSQDKATNQDQQEEAEALEQIPEFKLNLDKYCEHYKKIEEATTDLKGLLDEKKQCTQISFHRKLAINKAQFKLWKKETSNGERAYLCHYEIPCSYSFYSELMNKKYSVNDSHKLFLESQLIESLSPNLCSKYLCFNKFSMVDKRDFKYLKYTYGIDKYHWEICITDDNLNLQKDNKAKPSQFHSVSLLNENVKDNQHFLKVKTYLRVDIGVSAQKIWEKMYAQMREYVEKIWKEAADNYEEELV